MRRLTTVLIATLFISTALALPAQAADDLYSNSCKLSDSAVIKAWKSFAKFSGAYVVASPTKVSGKTYCEINGYKSVSSSKSTYVSLMMTQASRPKLVFRTTSSYTSGTNSGKYSSSTAYTTAGQKIYGAKSYKYSLSFTSKKSTAKHTVTRPNGIVGTYQTTSASAKSSSSKFTVVYTEKRKGKTRYKAKSEFTLTSSKTPKVTGTYQVASKGKKYSKKQKVNMTFKANGKLKSGKSVAKKIRKINARLTKGSLKTSLTFDLLPTSLEAVSGQG